jgi:hypothetical protein
MTHNISVNSLVEIFLRTFGATPVTFIAATTPNMRKTGNPYSGRVTKVARINGMVNFQYDAGVIRRLEKEGKSADEFTAGTSWHTPVKVDGKLTPLCEHKSNGQQYLRFMLGAVLECEYQLDDGTVIDKATLEPWLVKGSDYANQGLENPLCFLTYKLDSIKSITMDGTTYIVN